MRLSEEDFLWLLGRLGKGADTAFGQALHRVWVGGELPAMACRAIGLQISRFSAIYDLSRRVVAGMTVCEEDGFTAEEVELGNRVLAVARRKESPFEPNAAQWEAMGRISKEGPLTVPLSHDACQAMLGLLTPGYLVAEMKPPASCAFELTDKGRQALEDRFR